jgi:hypothetical protein
MFIHVLCVNPMCIYSGAISCYMIDKHDQDFTFSVWLPLCFVNTDEFIEIASFIF